MQKNQLSSRWERGGSFIEWSGKASEKVISEQRSNEGGEGMHHMDIWGKAFQAEGTIGKGLRQDLAWTAQGPWEGHCGQSGGSQGKSIRRWRQRGQGVNFILLKEMGRH